MDSYKSLEDATKLTSGFMNSLKDDLHLSQNSTIFAVTEHASILNISSPSVTPRTAEEDTTPNLPKSKSLRLRSFMGKLLRVKSPLNSAFLAPLLGISSKVSDGSRRAKMLIYLLENKLLANETV